MSVSVPELGRSPQSKLSMVYAGDTWLEEMQDLSLALGYGRGDVFIPKGDEGDNLPQQIVVIMQLRN